MEVFGAAKQGILGGSIGALQVGLAAAAVGSVAVAGGLGPQSVPTPAPVVTPAPTPPPTPAPTPVPSPVSAIGPDQIGEAEQRLSDLGYWAGPIDGTMDAATRFAIVAFQKVNGRPRTGRLTPDELQAIRTAQRPAPRITGYPHVEVDVARQVLLFVGVDGIASHVLPISSGTDHMFTSDGFTRRAHTPRGRFTVYMKMSGWRKSPLGFLYYPSYIVGGIAVHGSESVPAFPASHGCIRVPMFAAKAVSDMMPIGTVVVVHGDGPLVQESDVASPPGKANPEAAVPATPPPPAEPSPRPTIEIRTPRPPRTPDIPTDTPEEPTPSP